MTLANTTIASIATASCIAVIAFNHTVVEAADVIAVTVTAARTTVDSSVDQNSERFYAESFIDL